MQLTITICTCILLGYLFGSLNLSYLLSKRKGYDIRERGSGNAGASNVIITIGKGAGALVAMVDILKAFIVVRLCLSLFPEFAYAGVIAATSVILGHIFPFYMGFRGGKGLAALGGSILAIDYRLFFLFLLFALLLAFVTDYICFVPILVSLLFPAIYGYIMHDINFTLILYVATVFIWWKHLENLQRIRNGKELRFSFLWNRAAEAERFGVENDDGVSCPFEFDRESREENRS